MKVAKIIKVCNDTCNLLSYILDEGIRIEFETYLEYSDKINKTSSTKCFHLIIKSVLDEISSVLSTNIGYLIQDMSKRINEIITTGEKAIDMKQLRELHEYIEGLDKKFPKMAGLIRFIKKTRFDTDQYFKSLVDIKTRRKIFGEILSLKNEFDLNYFMSFFGTYSKYYDPTDGFIDFQIKEDFQEVIEGIFKGSRSRRNTYDKIHLYSCCLYSKSYSNHNLKFATKDKIILKGAPQLLHSFQILTILQLNKLLLKEIPQLPEP